MNSLTITMERLRNQIELVTIETEQLSRNIIYDEDVQILLQKGQQGEKYPSNNDVSYFINSFIINRQYIESVVLISENTTLFSTEKAYTNVSTIEQIQKKWWFPNLQKEIEPFMWYGNALSQSEFEKTQNNNIMLTRLIRSLQDYKTPIGRMMIYINEDYINRIFDDIALGRTTNIWVIDNNDNVILKNTSSEDYSFLVPKIIQSTQPEIIKYESTKYVVERISFENSQWNLLVASPYKEVDQGIVLIKIQLIIVSIIVMVIIFLMSIFNSASMSKPISTLSSIMDLYHGEFSKGQALEINAYNSRKDEIGVMYRSYQKLVTRIETLIKKIYIKDLERKDAELALLETQINPHFLYNTLDSINWMALANGQEEISEMVTALSDTFRLSLTKNNSSFVDMAHELLHVESYLTIQKIRFGDRLICNYKIDEETKKLQVLRFVMQPIVENSLKHGINTCENGGTIDITAKIYGEILCISVVNDGIDINLDQMEKYLFFDVNDTEYLSFEKKGYGLQNINRRIKIIHGPDYGIKYSIVNNSRTKCVISLPITICEK
jgi:two-component system sensor histidine kinase YesM